MVIDYKRYIHDNWIPTRIEKLEFIKTMAIEEVLSNPKLHLQTLEIQK
jgi:hypothetical protein